MSETKNKIDLQFLACRWPSAIVARSEIGAFTGGTLNARTLANLDSIGEGPANRMRVGRKICYPVASLIEWLESRAEIVD